MTATSTPSPRSRVLSLDIVRGAVMVLMAIDHVRVYAGVPPGGPTPGVFFTRWVTHFCAPAFVFLAGTAAYLYGQKVADPKQLSRFLATRGAWLILLELTVLRFGWTFNVDYGDYLLAGVIWMIGWCMVLMAVVVRMPLAGVAALGAGIVGLHNLTDLASDQLSAAAQASATPWLWQILYLGGPLPLGGDGGPTMAVLYSIVPWIGVMALGYAFGWIIRLEPARRTKACYVIGMAAILLFLILRGFNWYGDPWPWGTGNMPAWLAFLSTTKYPASLSFLLMTLGPTVVAVALLDRAGGKIAAWVATFGRVPFFYYVLHIPLIHLLALGVAFVRTPESVGWLFENHPMMMPPAPADYQWSLPLLYLVFVVAVGLLYFPCRWFADLKARRSDWWLGYL